ncbi:MAG TPA: LysE family transporter [Candidatus Limnocylindrales bacterium]|nr:LysE family transporter [Candidatus Limnocylindrales bacterium]
MFSDIDLPLPIRGLVIGFTIAMAVGPITLLVIRRTIDHGGLYGFASGLGVATADASYAAVAAFGLTAISSALVSGHLLLGVIGGAIIAFMGYRTMISKPTVAAPDAQRPGMVGAFASIYALTMTNPLTIVLYAGVFAGIGLVAGSSFADAAVITLAAWLGSTLWWVILCSVVGWVRGRVSARAMLWVNRISGAMLVVFGIVAIAGAVKGAVSG